MRAERPRPERAAFVGCLLLLAFAALGARLAQVQLADGARYVAAARVNQVRLIPVAAPRGRMVDRDGTVLVRSRPSFVAALVPSQVRDPDAVLAELARVLGVPQARLRDRMYRHRGLAYAGFAELAAAEPFGPVILAEGLTNAQTARLAEDRSNLPGIDLEAQPVRDYPRHAEGAHAFGYVGRISAEEYERLRTRGYSPNDVVGKDGLEAAYDAYLRGRPGGQAIEVDAAGSLKRYLHPVDPVPGDTLVLTLDGRLQALVESALRDEIRVLARTRRRRISGAVVVLDPATGGVLALASTPAFDPNAFATGIDARTYGRLTNDPLHPLFDRAIGAATPTGSTFKMVTGSAAISAGVIGRNQVLYDSGAWNCHGALFRDLASGGLGRTDFTRALAASSDGYFYQLGDRLGNERLRYYALQYGLGHVLGIDVGGEYAGNWPTNAWSLKTYGVPLEPSDACQLAIGQGAMQATPLQMADVAATVVNGGTLYRPRLVDRIVDANGRIVRAFPPEIIRRVPVTAESLREVRAGMDAVTSSYGTAAGLAVPGVPFGGKTGTAETAGGKGPNTTWFVAYAPARRPRLAMAILMERTGGYGASVAGPIARAVIAGYLAKPPQK